MIDHSSRRCKEIAYSSKLKGLLGREVVIMSLFLPAVRPSISRMLLKATTQSAEFVLSRTILATTRNLPQNTRYLVGDISPSWMPNWTITSPSTSLADGLLFIKRTFQPSIIRKKRKTGFLVRQRTVGGRRTLKRRKAKGRWRLGGGI